MNIIEWNIGFGANPELVYKALSEYMKESYIFILLEVVPDRYRVFKELFACSNLEYSLEYRVPGKYDGKSRQLGVLLITSKDVSIESAGVFERTLLPDRTLYATFNREGKVYKIAALHSITGCSHLKAKSLNYLSMAEEVENFKPDIFVMDANEPKKDHYEIEEMEFFEKNGKGARVFFETLKTIGLKDAYVLGYDRNTYIDGESLATSHIIKGTNKNVRYDFAFINENAIDCKNVSYHYQKAVDASADHAILLLEC